MKNKGLLFIPDISGFTRFVSETEIEHSRLIIQELLEALNSRRVIASAVVGQRRVVHAIGGETER